MSKLTFGEQERTTVNTFSETYNEFSVKVLLDGKGIGCLSTRDEIDSTGRRIVKRPGNICLLDFHDEEVGNLRATKKRVEVIISENCQER